MKTVLVLAFGALLLFLGLTALPRLLARIGREDDAEVLGRSMVVGTELVLGGWLLMSGIRAARRK